MPANFADDLRIEGDIVVDLTDVHIGGVSVGWHSMEVEEVHLARSSKKNTPQMVASMVICDEGDPEYGRKATAFLQLQGGGRAFIKAFFEAVKFDSSTVLTLNTATLTEALVGLKLDVKFVEEEWEGDTRIKPNWYEPYGSKAGSAFDMGLGLAGTAQ